MSKNSNGVKKWRKDSKERIVKAMGGGCCICGYNKCHAALALHHLDPTQKDFGLGGIRASIVGWDKIVSELRKCVLLCNNCHSEFHAGEAVIPIDAPRFNEEFADYKENNRVAKMEPCPICNKLKEKINITCSPECSAKRKRRIDWDSIDLPALFKEHKTATKLVEILGVSDVSIGKRLKKLGLK